MPAFAFESFVDGCSIDPVRSSTIMTSSGRPPHGEQAEACTLSVIVLMPINRRKYVGMFAVSVMCTVFAGLQNVVLVEQSQRDVRVDVGDTGDAVLPGVLGAQVVRGGARGGGVGEVPSAGGDSGVRGGLEGLLHAVRVADIDDRAAEQEQRQQEHDHQRERLP